MGSEVRILSLRPIQSMACGSTIAAFVQVHNQVERRPQPARRRRPRASLKLVQARLGHASITMTADCYGHLFPRGDDRAELAAAEKAFLETPCEGLQVMMQARLWPAA